MPSVSYNSKLLIPLIKDFIVCRSAIIEKYYSQAEKQIVCVTDLGEPFNVGNLAKDDLAETGMPCVIYGELFTTYGEIISQIESHTNKTEGMILSKKGDLLFPSSTTVDAKLLLQSYRQKAIGKICKGKHHNSFALY